MQPVYLAFLWHHHQPYYPDDVGDGVRVPWVRLHGSKDYWGMAKHLEQHPEVRATFNLTPSLIIQLLDYAEHGREDDLLQISRIPADSLTVDQAIYLLEHGFQANLDHMIRPYPRYYQLWRLRGAHLTHPHRVLKRFGTKDLRDLQVWANLAWIHGLAFEEDENLAELRRKERNFSEDEKLWVLEKQLELLREVLPLYVSLAERGQIELTVSPFFHPILPLLINKELALAALPHLQLPEKLGRYPEDADWHVREALNLAEKVFGKRPRGMWPSEGAVCEEMVPIVARHGVEWIATDEEILSLSLDGRVGREPHTGYVRNPHLLYRPWSIERDGAELHVIFRDQALSNLISFHYQRVPAAGAVEDFIGKLLGVRQAVGGDHPPFVPVILDGENCWEHYPNGGIPFLRRLYAELARSDLVRTCTISEYLDEFGDGDRLPWLFPGSWIHHNFAIWIGQEEDRTAWDLLAQTRNHLVSAATRETFTAETLEKAWREIYIAEGSDWFWWYGDEHPTPYAQLYDTLFRKHLQNVYRLLGEQPPSQLAQPIHVERRVPYYQEVTGKLTVHVDGRASFLEWLGAGQYVPNGSREGIQRERPGIVQALWFGFGDEAFYIRLDTAPPAVDVLRPVDAIRVTFVRPVKLVIDIQNPARDSATITVLRDGQADRRATGQVRWAVDRVAEMSIELALLGIGPQDTVGFFVELYRGPTAIDRVPRDGLIEVPVPDEDLYASSWIA